MVDTVHGEYEIERGEGECFGPKVLGRRQERKPVKVGCRKAGVGPAECYVLGNKTGHGFGVRHDVFLEPGMEADTEDTSTSTSKTLNWVE